jgi:cysteine desulfurase
MGFMEERHRHGGYFDHNATTPLAPEAREAMLPWLEESFGNPSSIHRYGQAAREAVEKAREQVATLVGAQPVELVFTASGSEANNMVFAHVARTWNGSGHLVISAFEHPSVREAAADLEDQGMAVTRVPPGADGVVPAEAVIEALQPDTRLVSLMLANNEVGTLQPVAEVAAACRERGVLVLSDAVQAVGKVPVDVTSTGADFVPLAAHKVYGPLGAAALWVRSGVEITPLLRGGSQERRRRASTENVSALAGFGAAAELAERTLDWRWEHFTALRDRFEAGVCRMADGIVHCQESPRLPQTSHVAFGGVEGEALLIRLDLAGFAVSTGSACSSGTPEPSKALLAMGMDPEEALSSLRISFGIDHQAADVDRLLEAVETEVAALRQVTTPTGRARG